MVKEATFYGIYTACFEEPNNSVWGITEKELLLSWSTPRGFTPMRFGPRFTACCNMVQATMLQIERRCSRVTGFCGDLLRPTMLKADQFYQIIGGRISVYLRGRLTKRRKSSTPSDLISNGKMRVAKRRFTTVLLDVGLPDAAAIDENY